MKRPLIQPSNSLNLRLRLCIMERSPGWKKTLKRESTAGFVTRAGRGRCHANPDGSRAGGGQREGEEESRAEQRGAAEQNTTGRVGAGVGLHEGVWWSFPMLPLPLLLPVPPV